MCRPLKNAATQLKRLTIQEKLNLKNRNHIERRCRQANKKKPLVSLPFACAYRLREGGKSVGITVRGTAQSLLAMSLFHFSVWNSEQFFLVFAAHLPPLSTIRLVSNAHQIPLVKNSFLTKYPPTTNRKPAETSLGDCKQYTRRMCIVINDPQSDVPQYAFRLENEALISSEMLNLKQFKHATNIYIRSQLTGHK